MLIRMSRYNGRRVEIVCKGRCGGPRWAVIRDEPNVLTDSDENANHKGLVAYCETCQHRALDTYNWGLG